MLATMRLPGDVVGINSATASMTACCVHRVTPGSAARTCQCYQVFDTEMRDVDFCPDGGYLAVVTTGGAPDRYCKSPSPAPPGTWTGTKRWPGLFSMP